MVILCIWTLQVGGPSKPFIQGDLSGLRLKSVLENHTVCINVHTVCVKCGLTRVIKETEFEWCLIDVLMFRSVCVYCLVAPSSAWFWAGRFDYFLNFYIKNFSSLKMDLVVHQIDTSEEQKLLASLLCTCLLGLFTCVMFSASHWVITMASEDVVAVTLLSVLCGKRLFSCIPWSLAGA